MKPPGETPGRIMRRCGACGERHALGETCPRRVGHRWGHKRTPRTYDDPEYRRNRAVVLERSQGRCEAIVDGRRCGAPGSTVDHIEAVGVATARGKAVRHDVDNLRLLCPHCKVAKDAADARAVMAIRRATARKRAPGRRGRTF